MPTDPAASPELLSYLEGLPEPHILFDRSYRILGANAAYRAQHGGAAPVIGRTCFDVSHGFEVPCDQAGESCPLASSLQSGQRERVLHLHHTPQGEAYVNIELVPLRGEDGQASLFIEKMQPLRVAQSLPSGQGLIGRSPAFQEMLSLVARVGPTEASVLLQGESGTGKELVARALHEASTRSARPLVVVEGASLTETLFESELFGHERGAFTGAQTSKPGLVEAADGGTLFLDEIGDIPLPMQVKLLRLLESGTYRRVGSTELRHAHVRVISASHRDLPQLVVEGRFREDLYHRLSTFPIHLPPLRQRREDIPLLARALLQRVAPKRTLSLTPDALQALAAHSFPGNVRELRNVLERAALLCDGHEISAPLVQQALAMGCTACRAGHPHAMAHTPGLPLSRLISEGQQPEPAPTPTSRREHRQTQAQTELQAALARHPHDRPALAQALGISLRTLYRRLAALEGGR